MRWRLTAAVTVPLLVIMVGALAVCAAGCATPIVQNARNYAFPYGSSGRIVENADGGSVEWTTTGVLQPGEQPAGWVDQSITQSGSGTTSPQTSGRLGASVAAGQNTSAGAVDASGEGGAGDGAPK